MDIVKFEVPVLPTKDDLRIGISNEAEQTALQIQKGLAKQAESKSRESYFYDLSVPREQRKKVTRIMRSWAEAQGYSYYYYSHCGSHGITCNTKVSWWSKLWGKIERF